jgi:hypothetical protein
MALVEYSLLWRSRTREACHQSRAIANRSQCPSSLANTCSAELNCNSAACALGWMKPALAILTRRPTDLALPHKKAADLEIRSALRLLPFLAISKLSEPVLDHANGRGGFAADGLDQHKPLAVLGNVVLWPAISGDPLVLEQTGCLADCEVGYRSDSHGEERLALEVIEFPTVATPAWLDATLSGHLHLSATLGKTPHVDLVSS